MLNWVDKDSEIYLNKMFALYNYNFPKGIHVKQHLNQKNYHLNIIGDRLDFIRQINYYDKPYIIQRLLQIAKEIENDRPEKAYRIRRIYIPIIKQGEMPNTWEFPVLMRKAHLSLDILIKELEVFYNVSK